MLMLEYNSTTRAAARESCVRNPDRSIGMLASPSCFLSALLSLLVEGVDTAG